MKTENENGNSGPNSERVKIVSIVKADQIRDPEELIIRFSDNSTMHINKEKYNAIIEYGPHNHNSLALNIIRCVFDLGGNYGRTTIARMLTGEVSKKILTININKLGTYGTAKDCTMKEVLTLIDWLIQENYLAYREDSEVPVLICTCKGLDVIAGGALPWTLNLFLRP